MSKKLHEMKVLRDPVHEYVRIEEPVIWQLLDTREFQRLRRIHQLGGTYQVYHGAEHSRFSHSLGVYEIARRMINEVKDLKNQLTYPQQQALLCAALLHDIGHGPFSHAFEQISKVHHEEMSAQIILGDTQINEVLCYERTSLPEEVVAILQHRHENPILSQLVSAQLDCDRMDYLLRDAFFTGVSYGKYDLERILRTMRIRGDKVVVKASGISAVEDYIMARYQMYWQVYYHPTSRAFEILLFKLFKRIADVFKQNPDEIDHCVPFLRPFLDHGTMTIEQHLFLDEDTIMHGFKMLSSESKDPVLKDLARRVLERDLFKFVDYYDEHQLQGIVEGVRQSGYDPTYYVDVDLAHQKPYIPYISDKGNPIWVLDKDGIQIKELSKVSPIVDAIIKANVDVDKKVFFPLERSIYE